MEILLYLLLFLSMLILFFLLLIFRQLNSRRRDNLSRELEIALGNNQRDIRENMESAVERLGNANLRSLKLLGDKLWQLNQHSAEAQGRQLKELKGEVANQLAEIREIVDEKMQGVLEKRISESFRSVSSQLEQVYKGLGEMKALAGDVGGLKKILSGVKTRGILGELQLENILAEILANEQYDKNVETIPNSGNRVEFAIRLPGQGNKEVYLPIDAKFPGDLYHQVLEARETGDKKQIEALSKKLEQRILMEAKDIHTKYVEPPYTTNFAILFLPFEGLYAEAVNLGMVEKLQREYQINLAGPSTMAALLNSLQIGFRTMALQRRSMEVWDILSGVKVEFEKYEEAMQQMQRHIRQVDKDLENLIVTRTNMMHRRLRAVELLTEERKDNEEI